MGRPRKIEQRNWIARLRVTYDVEVTVTAASAEDARIAVKSGAWDTERVDDVIDWTDATSIREDF